MEHDTSPDVEQEFMKWLKRNKLHSYSKLPEEEG
jgi:hypothetical protein